MRKNITIKKLIIGIIILLLGVLGYEILWGILFPFSPVIFGFSRQELPHIIIYIQKGADPINGAMLDSLAVPVEKYHELRFIKKPEIFIFKDRDKYLRQSFSNARFCAYPSGRLFISPWADKEAQAGKISLEIYVKHELSHVIIYQQKGLLAGYRYPKWLLEGIGVHSTNQMGTSFYPSKEETYRAIAQGNFMPPFDFKTKKEDQTKLNVKYRIAFMYSEFGCMVDYLITKYGKDKFLIYIKTVLSENDHHKVFKQTYGIDFESFIQDFIQEAKKNANLKSDLSKTN